MRRLCRLITVLTVLLGSTRASNAFAQTDIIRGRITGPDNAPVARANVTVTSLTGNVSRVVRTDADGRYTIAFPGNDGDYFVNIAALGFAAKRFQIKRTGDQEILIANAKLSVAAQQLDAVKVAEQRVRPTRVDSASDISGSERPITPSSLSIDQLADLASLAGSLPGVQLIPGADGTPNAFSVLAVAPDQNATTLNGMAFGGSSLPRDANVSTSVVTTPYDVSRGNFSGGLMSVRTQPGSNYITRITSTSADAPPLQWAGPTSQPLGQRYGGLSTGGRASGPIQFDKSFYSVAYQAGRQSGDVQSLLNAGRDELLRDGLASDSVSRLLGVLQRRGVPTRGLGAPRDRLSDNAMVFGTVDFAPPLSTSGEAYNITFNGAWNRQDPASTSVGELPAHSGERANWYGGVQARMSGYYGVGVLSETSVGVNRTRFDGSPFVDLPNGIVRVSSVLPDDARGVQMVSIGGNPFFGSSQTATTAQVQNQLSWFTEDNRHRLKLATDVRRDQYAQDITVNTLGTFTFESIADLEAGRASSFARTLGSRRRSESDYAAGLSLGDTFRPSTDFQLQYGVRVDGNRFTSRPTYNADVERTFGLRNDRVPSVLALSPRVGFSWTYGTADQASGFEGAMKLPRAVVRGGIGVFQSTPNATLIGTAMDNTGLSGDAGQVRCVGAAVPTVDWSAYAANLESIPTTCANGSSAAGFAASAPNVALFEREYMAPRSVRSNLQWSGPVVDNRFSLLADVTYSLNVDQPGFIDRNFADVSRFALGDDGRPVFAQTTGIVPTTGAIAAGEGRRASAFSRVTELRSDMRSEAKQFTAQLRPAMFDSRFTWALSYVYSQAREQYRGFSSTAANPLDVAWGRSSLDSRHQFVYAFTYNAWDVVRLMWYGTARSGNPFTPMVAGDINGDGFANDRAFIADPNTLATRDSALANGMRTVLAGAPGWARSCLRSQLGRIADRNSCQGPWTTTGTLTLSFKASTLRLPQRADVSLQLSNPFAAADAVLHGSSTHGWGERVIPMSELLFVRGFDPASKRYAYEVNPRFGSNTLAQSALRSPVALTAIVRIDVGPTRERQALTQMLDRGRTQPGQKMSEPVIKALYGVSSIVNPLAQILRQSDSLGLSGEQADSIAVLNRRYTVRLDSIWSPVAKRLASLPERYEQAMAYGEYQRAREANVDALLRIAPLVNSLLTPAQRRKLPIAVTSYLDSRFLASVRSGTSGTGLGAIMMPDGLALPAGVGNASQAAIMMLHGGGTP